MEKRENASKKKLSLKKRCLKRISSAPLWVQLTIFLTIILLVLTFSLTYTTYVRNRESAIRNRISYSRQTLSLKLQDLDRYLDGLSSFCDQPKYDGTFYKTILSPVQLTFSDITPLKDNIRVYYYSRSDILFYRISLTAQNLSMARDSAAFLFNVYPPEKLMNTEAYRLCAASQNNSCILPNTSPDSFFTYCHAIYNTPGGNILAIVEVLVNRDELNNVTQKGDGSSEFFCLYNSANQLLYSGNSGLVSQGTMDLNSVIADKNPDGRNIVELNGTDYLVTEQSSSLSGIRILSLIPVEEITKDLKKSQGMALLEGILFLMIAVLAAYLLIRYFTKPLTVLCQKQKDVGSGDFSGINIRGSREISDLNRSFNEMTTHIDELLKQNYAAGINEKTAKLTALEAQINPHFLNNTLQAIGSEALLNNQPEIYRMLTSLASNLRYSIKAPNIVQLKEEVRYVDNYILLQKMRMEDRLSVSKKVNPSTLDIRVPKISIQPLVENSILHGLGEKRTSIRIEITITLENEDLKITVRDNGCGIPENSLEQLRNSFKAQTLQDPGQNIGLSNLYHRILILYDGRADLRIESKTGENSFTCVTLLIPASYAPASENSATESVKE